MNKKRKLALMLALEMFLSGCAIQKQVNKENNTTKLGAEKEIVVDIPQETQTTEVEKIVEIIKTNADLEREKEEQESFQVQFGYLKKSSTLVHDDGNETTLDKYQRVLVLEDLDGIYYVETYDEDEGIILKSDIEIIPNTFVEVDISSQTLNVFNDGEIIITTPVVTGKPKTPTHEGYYQIKYKSRNVTLRGPGYASFVKYWMPYDDTGRGLHDASWRSQSEYNTQTYLTSGSHGCVNIPVSEAPKVYENVNAGTKVLIHK